MLISTAANVSTQLSEYTLQEASKLKEKGKTTDF